MKRKMKHYLVFTSRWYQAITFVVLPVVVLLLYYWLRDFLPEVGLIVGVVILMMAECILDIWLFGGIQAKGTRMLEYLKTSELGREVLKDAIFMDLLRRFLAFVGVMGICFLLEGQRWNSVQVVSMRFFTVLLGYSLSTLGVWLGRFEGNYWTNMVISYAVVALGIAGYFLPGLARLSALYALLLAVVAVLVSRLAVSTAMKKMEGSYYDT